MALNATEEAFLAGHRLGRLATVGPSCGPQVKPVGFAYNHELGTIDIGGFNMAQSAKYLNVQRHPEVAFVVDTGAGAGFTDVHFLEIRGVEEAVAGQVPSLPDTAAEIIRIHPRRAGRQPPGSVPADQDVEGHLREGAGQVGAGHHRLAVRIEGDPADLGRQHDGRDQAVRRA